MVQGENYVLFTRYDINIAKAAEMILCMCVHGLNTKNIYITVRTCLQNVFAFSQLRAKFHGLSFCSKVRKMYDTLKWTLVFLYKVLNLRQKDIVPSALA